MPHTPDSTFSKWLKKYRYINIALIYLGTALVVIHFAEAVVHGLHMPDITFSLIVVLALAGLPIVLLIAWAMGTKKEETTEEASVAKPPKRNWSKIITASVLGIVLFAAAIFVYNKFFYHSKFTGKEKSIAVLPFTNMSSDKENEYFSDGMTEEITTQLSKIAQLKVIDHNSTKSFRDTKKTFKEIAEELGVTSLCKGSVRKEGNDIRITAQLIDANTQQQIWAETWDREFKEVFAIQSEVAHKIAYQLNAKLTKEEKYKIEKQSTNNPEAYIFYLQGYQLHVNYYETRKPEHFENSRNLFEKALALDPNYALAHAGLADLYNSYSKVDKQIISLQLKEIEKAWKIDSTNDYVNYVKGTIEQDPLGNKENALKYSKNAVEINPNSSTNLWGLALTMASFGLFEESKILLDRVVELDPLTANNFLMRGYCNFILNNPDEAIRDLETAIRLQPDFFWAIDVLAEIYSSIGRLDDAKKMIERSLKIEPIPKNHPAPAINLAYAFAQTGNKKIALELAPNDWRVLLVLEMNEEALKAMPYYDESKKDLNTPYLIFIHLLVTKKLDALRNDPRFLKIMERSQKQYEENKKKFNIVEILKKLSS